MDIEKCVKYVYACIYHILYEIYIYIIHIEEF